MRPRHGLRHAALALVVAIAACAGTGMRSTPATRYEGILLNGRKLGADETKRQAAADPTIRAYVAQHGNPDFILPANPTNTELVYTGRSVLAYFHRPTASAPSVMTEVTPLPTGLNLMLPSDLRAGTSQAISPVGPNCWTVPIAGQSCRTCCLTGAACTVECKTTEQPVR